MSDDVKIRAIDALLPQTQCGECDYAGCLPYATAIIKDGAAINRCPPGGTQTLQALAEFLNQDATPYLTDMQAKTRPPSIATIRESECIGCTKCIQACPVDAIIGAGKLMHTVLTDECTGCGLCVAPCPVDCIDLHAIPNLQFSKQKSRERFQARNQRLADEATQKREKHIEKIKLEQPEDNQLSAKQAFIQAAIARAKAKKGQS